MNTLIQRLFKKKLPVLENGTIQVGSEQFRRVHAYNENGTVLVYDDQYDDPAIVKERKKLRKQGQIPGKYKVREISATLDQIAEAYNARTNVTTTETFIADRTIGERLYDILERAADLRAQDVKINVRAHSTEVRIVSGGAEHDFDGLKTREDGENALAFLFNRRDSGSGHAMQTNRTCQSFSVSSSDLFRLPPTLKKLRGEKGYHETPADIKDHVALRLFYAGDSAETGKLEDLGFDEEVLKALARMRRKSDGAMIMGGATGEGKSTTLIRTVEKLHRERGGKLGIVTIEDPVEIQITLPGVIQIPIQSTGDGDEMQDNYRKVLSHFVRIHPNMGVVSEMRNADAIKQVLQFVASGHTVYTTVHVRSAVTIPFRLISMGIEPQELGQPDVIRTLIKQSLIQELCKHCAIPLVDTDLHKALETAYGRSVQPMERNSYGCEHCLKLGTDQERNIWAGYKRLIAVGEVIEVDDTFRECIVAKDALAAKRHWLTPKPDGGLGGRLIGQKLVDLCATGRVDIHDALNKGMDEFVELEVQL